MGDLIDREAAIKALEFEKRFIETETRKDGIDDAIDAITFVPSIPAVPLDKLCEWLSENALDITRRDITPLKKDAEHWRKLITEWVERLDAADRR